MEEFGKVRYNGNVPNEIYVDCGDSAPDKLTFLLANSSMTIIQLEREPVVNDGRCNPQTIDLPRPSPSCRYCLL